MVNSYRRSFSFAALIAAFCVIVLYFKSLRKTVRAVILYKYGLHKRVSWEIVTPRKPILTKAKPRLTLVFEGRQFPMLPSFAVNYYYIILNVNIKYIVYITYGFKTNWVKWIFVFVFHIPYIQTLIRHQSESMVNSARINYAQSIFFWNITRRQTISPVAKSRHVLVRGFMIHRVIFIFIKCRSANQNQLFYMKV